MNKYNLDLEFMHCSIDFVSSISSRILIYQKTEISPYYQAFLMTMSCFFSLSLLDKGQYNTYHARLCKMGSFSPQKQIGPFSFWFSTIQDFFYLCLVLTNIRVVSSVINGASNRDIRFNFWTYQM